MSAVYFVRPVTLEIAFDAPFRVSKRVERCVVAGRVHANPLFVSP